MQHIASLSSTKRRNGHDSWSVFFHVIPVLWLMRDGLDLAVQAQHAHSIHDTHGVCDTEERVHPRRESALQDPGAIDTYGHSNVGRVNGSFVLSVVLTGFSIQDREQVSRVPAG